MDSCFRQTASCRHSDRRRHRRRWDELPLQPGAKRGERGGTRGSIPPLAGGWFRDGEFRGGKGETGRPYTLRRRGLHPAKCRFFVFALFHSDATSNHAPDGRNQPPEKGLHLPPRRETWECGGTAGNYPRNVPHRGAVAPTFADRSRKTRRDRRLRRCDPAKGDVTARRDLELAHPPPYIRVTGARNRIRTAKR